MTLPFRFPYAAQLNVRSDGSVCVAYPDFRSGRELGRLPTLYVFAKREDFIAELTAAEDRKRVCTYELYKDPVLGNLGTSFILAPKGDMERLMRRFQRYRWEENGHGSSA